MVDWSNPSGFQLEALHEALLFAYPTPLDLNNLLVLRLERTYAAVAPVAVDYDNALIVILQRARAEGWLQTLVEKARRHRPNSPKLRVLDRSLEITAVEVPASLGQVLEDIVRHEGQFVDLFPWIAKLEKYGWRTCRIEYPVNTAQGTGWLVGPDLLLTNWHVIDRALPGGDRQATNFVCRFDYAETAAGTQGGTEVRLAQDWCVDASPPSAFELGTGTDAPSNETLDYALVRLAKGVGNEPTAAGEMRGWVVPRADQGLPQQNEIVFVVQHPEGLPVKLAAGDVKGTSPDNFRFFHSANTKGGASGSVVVNAKLDVIGLHHAGDLLYHRGKIGTPDRNQAVPIGHIISRLQAKGHLR